jgi:hypothetical protein
MNEKEAIKRATQLGTLLVILLATFILLILIQI